MQPSPDRDHSGAGTAGHQEMMLISGHWPGQRQLPGQAVQLSEAEAAPLFEASCHLLCDPATRPEDFWRLPRNGTGRK